MFLNRRRLVFQQGEAVQRLWRATINSWNGLAAVARTEAAFRLELVVLAVAIPLAFMLTDDGTRRILLIGSLTLVIVVELINTAIEKLADRLTRKRDREIGQVKDIASAAVGVSLALAAGIWLWALMARLTG
jgi:diacylglycerol kinase (ATP)